MERKSFSLWRIARRLGLFWVAFPLAFALVFGGVAVAMGAQMALLARDGVTGDAQVLERQIERRRSSDGDESITYFLRYSFTLGHADAMVKRQSVSRSLYQSVREGESIPVVYAWSQPERASVDLQHDRFGLILFGSFGGIGALVSLGLGGWMVRRKLSVLRALRRGEVREARVTGLRRVNVRKNGRQQYVLDWLDAVGAKGSSMIGDPDAFDAHPAGSVIVVYIDPKTGHGWWDAQI